MPKIPDFFEFLLTNSRSRGTAEKYTRDVSAFLVWLGSRPLTLETASEWREHLLGQDYAPTTVNAMLASVNAYCRFLGLNIRVKFVKIQRKIFREQKRELSRDEYERLITTAQKVHKDRLGLIIETIGSTGIRVSEVKYITVEAIKAGKAVISLKGKVRTILLPHKLCQKLKEYAKKQKIASGEIFITGSGKSLSRKQIWAEMKKLCREAGVSPTKVFPHNLRHLFAVVFYRMHKDIVHLADILGHSSIETTRIYLITSGREHQRQLELLKLIS